MKKIKSKRVAFFCYVSPATLKEIKRRAKFAGISQGAVTELAITGKNKHVLRGVGFGPGQFAAKKKR